MINSNSQTVNSSVSNANANVLNDNHLELIAAFAKANKIGKAKVETFMREIMATIKVSSSAGKKVSTEMQLLRTKAEEVFQDLKGSDFTVSQLAEKLEVTDKIQVNNLVNYYLTKGILKITGKAEKPMGQRGRKANILAVVG